MCALLKLTPPEIDSDYKDEVMVFDLDDTLYSERDYMISGFAAVAKSASPSDFEALTKVMTEAYDSGENAMDALAESLSVSSEEREGRIAEWVKIYREHVPILSLPKTSHDTLEALKENGIRMALITDGRSVAQRAKIKALGLEKYFSDDCIYISEEHAAGKDTMAPFEYIAHIFPGASSFTYVADNPSKDFLHPNLMGWKTVCLLDKGKNIHRQNFDMAKEYLPSRTIGSLTELLTLKD